jgi:hypothetical protein
MTCRYIIAFTIISIFSMFFFYYNYVFCAVYVKASTGWFYSGIWSLFWVWVVFAPFVAMIVTLLDRSCSSKTAPTKSTYYQWIPMKILF